MDLARKVPAQRSARAVPSTIGAYLVLVALVLGSIGVWTSSMHAVAAGAAVGVVALLLLPTKVLPAVALWLLVLVPVGYMDIPRVVGRYFTPALIVIVVWIVRTAFAQRMTLLLRVPIKGWLIALPLLALLIASTISSGVHTGWSIAWTIVLGVCVAAPALIGQISQDDVWPTVRWSFAAIGLFLGVLAAVDFVLHLNPWTSLYRYEVSERTWAVFRTRTSLGHPLMTSTVASVAFAVCVFPSGKGRQWPYLLCAGGALVAVILSVSRTSVPTIAVAILVGVLSTLSGTKRFQGRSKGRLFSIAIAAGLFVVMALSPLLSARNQTSGGISSAAYRSQLLENAMEIIAGHPMLGSGPGTSSLAYGRQYGGILENSYIQLVVSIGLPAFIVFVMGVALVVLVAIRRSRAGAAAGLAAFMVSIAGFNVIDSNPGLLALAAPLIFCAVAPGARELEGRSGAQAPDQSAHLDAERWVKAQSRVEAGTVSSSSERRRAFDNG
jgi:O-antigen ligase